MPIELNRDNYENETLESNEAIIVDFWGPQCRPCLALMPAVERIEKDYSGKIRIAKVDVSKNRMLCARLRVLSVPTFILYKDGAEQNRLTGDNITESDLKKAIDAMVT